jgi:aryl-alcohol dehydrogenase-like predicted oxidoreductase
MILDEARAPLATGYSISRIIKGGWQLAGGHGPVDREAALEDMGRFVEAGITTFDCADIYTGVEALIGEFLRRLRASRGTAAIAGIQVHTKYVPDLAALPRLRPGDVEAAVERSLRRLGVERLDLVQLHWWDYAVPGWVEAALALAELRRKGKVREVGTTNFDVPRLRLLLDAGVPLAAHQVQYSIVDRRPENGMAALCRERGVALLCYGTLLGGFLSEVWLATPEPPAPLENRSLTKYRLILDAFGGWGAFQRLLAALSEVARRHAVGIGTVGLRWVLDRPGVAGVIVGARSARRLTETLAALSLRLDDADRERIDAATRGASGPAGDCYDLERDTAGPHAAVMRYDLNAADPSS